MHYLKCSTPYGIRGLGTNQGIEAWEQALGAQRLTASEVWALESTAQNHNQRLLCSTPYGIRGLGTPIAFAPTGADVNVLNALRHQRFGHLLLIAFRVNKLLVLNALRHQRFGHCCYQKPRGRHQLCAQRLTASEVWAPMGANRPRLRRACAQRLTASEVWARIDKQIAAQVNQSAQRLTASEVWAPCEPGGKF